MLVRSFARSLACLLEQRYQKRRFSRRRRRRRHRGRCVLRRQAKINASRQQQGQSQLFWCLQRWRRHRKTIILSFHSNLKATKPFCHKDSLCACLCLCACVSHPIWTCAASFRELERSPPLLPLRPSLLLLPVLVVLLLMMTTTAAEMTRAFSPFFSRVVFILHGELPIQMEIFKTSLCLPVCLQAPTTATTKRLQIPSRPPSGNNESENSKQLDSSRGQISSKLKASHRWFVRSFLYRNKLVAQRPTEGNSRAEALISARAADCRSVKYWQCVALDECRRDWPSYVRERE